MQIKRKSAFKAPVQDKQWFENWVARLEALNKKKYQRLEVETALGKTHIWGIHTDKPELEPLVIFPGARTTALFWDLHDNLKVFQHKFRIYLVETNGLPNLSDGASPDIKSTGYGEWAAELLDKLKLEKTFIAGASFGGLICMKLAIVAPQKVKAALLVNPGCLQPFSLSIENLYYNILPIVSPRRKNVEKFLNKAVFCEPEHTLSKPYWDLVVDYEVFALTRYWDNTQKPYYMNEELTQVDVDTYLLEGDQDLLFPFQQSVENAKKMLPRLRGVTVYPNVGHGIETYEKAIVQIYNTIEKLR